MTTKTRVNRVLATAAAAGLGALTALVVAAAPAQAICKGAGEGTMAYRANSSGRAVAWEGWVSGTCDRDGIYNGYLFDPYEDGYAARIRYRDGSFNEVVAYAFTDDHDYYRWYDQTGNRRAEFQLYASPGTRPSYWSDTWGY